MLHKKADLYSQSVLYEDPISSSKTTQLNSTGFRKHDVSMSCQDAPQKFNSKFSSKVSTLSSTASRVSKVTDAPLRTLSRMDSAFASREMRSNSKTSSAISRLTRKKDATMELDKVNNTQTTVRPFSSPVFVPRESQQSVSVDCSRKGASSTEAIAHSTASRKLHHIRQPSFSCDGSDTQLFMTASRPSSSCADDLGNMDSSSVSRPVVNNETTKLDESDITGMTIVAKKFERIMTVEQPVDKGKTFIP